MKKHFATLLTLILIQFSFSHAVIAKTGSNTNPQENAAVAQSAVINLNTANVTQLQTLSGIGKSKATAIIEYRENNGEFSHIDELTLVKGIGDKLLKKLEGKIEV